MKATICFCQVYDFLVNMTKYQRGVLTTCAQSANLLCVTEKHTGKY